MYLLYPNTCTKELILLYLNILANIFLNDFKITQHIEHTKLKQKAIRLFFITLYYGRMQLWRQALPIFSHANIFINMFIFHWPIGLFVLINRWFYTGMLVRKIISDKNLIFDPLANKLSEKHSLFHEDLFSALSLLIYIYI